MEYVVLEEMNEIKGRHNERRSLPCTFIRGNLHQEEIHLGVNVNKKEVNRLCSEDHMAEAQEKEEMLQKMLNANYKYMRRKQILAIYNIRNFLFTYKSSMY